MMSKQQNGLITQMASSVSQFVNENSRKLKTLRFLQLRTSKSGLLVAHGIRIMRELDKKSREAIILQHRLLSEMMQANTVLPISIPCSSSRIRCHFPPMMITSLISGG